MRNNEALQHIKTQACISSAAFQNTKYTLALHFKTQAYISPAAFQNRGLH